MSDDAATVRVLLVPGVSLTIIFLSYPFELVAVSVPFIVALPLTVQ